jgi:tRNA/tmRNA/rRNA uracil-C5-methylase (TrmA/RlmC/RlmD family)
VRRACGCHSDDCCRDNRDAAPAWRCKTEAVSKLAPRDQTLTQKLRRRALGIPRGFKELEGSLCLLGVFRALGWGRSVAAGAPVDANGDPLPWLTYPAIAWLERYVQPSHSVFEYGAGHSTLWFAKHAAKVYSVENNARWVARLKKSLPSNAELTLAEADAGEYGTATTSSYVQSITGFPDEHFDIILIDGMEREGCATLAAPKLSGDGIIIFDNSDRPGHHSALGRLHDDGFARVDFVGHAAGCWHPSCTSVLFRRITTFLRSDAPVFLGF